MQRMTIDLPTDIYEWVRSEAFMQHTTMREVILVALMQAQKRAERARKAV